jgi:hypothetical protein
MSDATKVNAILAELASAPARPDLMPDLDELLDAHDAYLGTSLGRAAESQRLRSGALQARAALWANDPAGALSALDRVLGGVEPLDDNGRAGLARAALICDARAEDWRARAHQDIRTTPGECRDRRAEANACAAAIRAAAKGANP